MNRNFTSFNLSKVERALFSCLGFPKILVNMVEIFADYETLSILYTIHNQKTVNANKSSKTLIPPKSSKIFTQKNHRNVHRKTIRTYRRAGTNWVCKRTSKSPVEIGGRRRIGLGKLGFWWRRRRGRRERDPRKLGDRALPICLGVLVMRWKKEKGSCFAFFSEFFLYVVEWSYAFPRGVLDGLWVRCGCDGRLDGDLPRGTVSFCSQWLVV